MPLERQTWVSAAIGGGPLSPAQGFWQDRPIAYERGTFGRASVMGRKGESASPWLGAGLGMLPVLATLAIASAVEAERTPSIRAVMHKQYRVTRAPFVLIKKELASDAPDWDRIGEASRDFTLLAASLEKNEPKWGDEASWLQFTEQHLQDARAMEDAAKARDRAALLVVHRRIETACKGCHDAHRTPRKESP
jgi:hypothetical protein